MTRGTAYIITKDKVLSTTEFNGSMSPEDDGDKMLEDLREVKHQADLEQLNNKWCETYGYGEESDRQLYEVLPLLAESLRWGENKYTEHERKKELKDNKDMLTNWKEGVIDFNIDYYKYWFSDWVFYKNISDRTIQLKTKGDEDTPSKTIQLPQGATIRLSFGRVRKDDHKDLPFKTLAEIEKKEPVKT